MLAIRWSRRALADLARIADFIAQDKPAAAQSFRREMRSKTENLRRLPQLGRRGELPDTSEPIVHRHDLLTYRVRADAVEILQVWHVAQ
ncbi:MAG: type II toxin-antitoxin system RelE/ParE family toxin [Thiobacillaceae bacterium]